MADHLQPRVNHQRLSSYAGQIVRLPSRVIKISDKTALVEACDGGEVEVKLPAGQTLDGNYIEVIGRVETGNVVQLMACIVLGDKLGKSISLFASVVIPFRPTDRGWPRCTDMQVLNDAIELSHHPDFMDMFQPV